MPSQPSLQRAKYQLTANTEDRSSLSCCAMLYLGVGLSWAAQEADVRLACGKLGDVADHQAVGGIMQLVCDMLTCAA